MLPPARTFKQEQDYDESMPRSILRKKQRERRTSTGGLSFSEGETGMGEFDKVPASSDPAQVEEQDKPEKQSNGTDEGATAPLLQRLQQKSLRSAGPAPPLQVFLALSCQASENFSARLS